MKIAIRFSFEFLVNRLGYWSVIYMSSNLIIFIGEKEYFINLTEPNGVYSISTHAGEKSVQWTIDVKAHPLPKLSW